jgi:hypothetical protein
MSDLIKALQIFLKYGNPECPTRCEHNEMQVHGYNAGDFSLGDLDKLKALGFHLATWNNWLLDEDGEVDIDLCEDDDWSEICFISHKYGSC